MKQTEQVFKGDSLHDRKAAVAGSFYPASKDELTRAVSAYFHSAGNKQLQGPIRALIVPHAGYIFSGITAASGFNQLDTGYVYDRVFIIGSSHRASYDKASVWCDGNYNTPLGSVEVDGVAARQLVRDNPKIFSDDVTPQLQEHSLEVQLPFLQMKYGKKLKIVPVLIGSHSLASCRDVARGLAPWFVPGNLFVISSDFSHYPGAEDAPKVDKETADAICTNDPEKFLKVLAYHENENIPGLVTSICGWTSVLTLLNITSGKNNLKYHQIKYMNSAESPYGDRNRVVGYQAIALTEEGSSTGEKKEFGSQDTYTIPLTDQRKLIEIARNTLEQFVRNGKIPAIKNADLPSSLQEQCGAFVTLRKKGALRGCIGQFIARDALWKVVQDMTVAAASRDYRFNPVMAGELDQIDLEISVLTPLKAISGPEEIVLGRDGVYIRKGASTGTFLPQVATETGWTLDEFLGHCARDKAGIGWDGWKSAELFTYQALIIEEKQ